MKFRAERGIWRVITELYHKKIHPSRGGQEKLFAPFALFAA
jgi:hypothetical protein